MSAEFAHQCAELQKGVVKIYPQQDWQKRLKQSVEKGIPLKIKFGLDPTSSHIHLGHLVILKHLRRFQDFGHQVQLIFGDFTARIGDPLSDKRNTIRTERIVENAKRYMKPLFKILDRRQTQIYYNSHWLQKLTQPELHELATQITMQELLQCNDFAKRYQQGQAIEMDEFFYPLMQGYDSVVLKSDVEIAGEDQRFYLMIGRKLQQSKKQVEQVVMTMPLLKGIDGVRKMGKSEQNMISLTDDAQQLFSQIMAIPDSLTVSYLQLLTSFSMLEIAQMKDELSYTEMRLQLGNHLINLLFDSAMAEKIKLAFLTNTLLVKEKNHAHSR